MSRTFETRPAVRERVPLLVGLASASGGGKTMSALRLATGMARITGGEIFYIDTEARRALHYADQFKFQHLDFKGPFSPLDYLDAIEFVATKKPGVIVVDSMSHEHEGEGGVLQWHDAEMGGDYKKSMGAWKKPKAARRKLLDRIIQLGVNVVFCFRAKEKLKLVTGKDPIDMGWSPIAGEEFVFEMTCMAMFYPAGGGVPIWNPTMPGERQMVKLPLQFKAIFEKSEAMSEEIGERLAQWAAGTSPSENELASIIKMIDAAGSLETLIAIGKAMRRDLTAEQRASVRAAWESRKKALESNRPAAPSGEPSVPDGTSMSDEGKRAEAGAPASSESPDSPPPVWTNATPSKCAECGVLRSKAASHGHNGECSLAGEK